MPTACALAPQPQCQGSCCAHSPRALAELAEVLAPYKAQDSLLAEASLEFRGSSFGTGASDRCLLSRGDSREQSGAKSAEAEEPHQHDPGALGSAKSAAAQPGA